jgi:hypothetical protein
MRTLAKTKTGSRTEAAIRRDLRLHEEVFAATEFLLGRFLEEALAANHFTGIRYAEEALDGIRGVRTLRRLGLANTLPKRSAA